MVALDINSEDGRIAYTLAETARMLGVNYQHFCRIVRTGEVKVTHVGKRKRIMKADLHAYLNRSH